MSAAPAPPGDGYGPGWHGKLPARGDFLGDGLPRLFLEPWEAWLQAAMATSSAALGAAWDRLFAAAPAWRFALSPGLCGPRAVVGVVVPSTDRVGRLYPLTIAAGLPATDVPDTAPFAAVRWFDRAEQAAQVAVAPVAPPPDGVAAAVAALGRPPRLPAADAAADRRHRGRLEAMVGALPDQPSLWWTRGSHWVMPSLVACSGMPSAERFAAFLDNGWERWGWHDLEGERPGGGARGLA